MRYYLHRGEFDKLIASIRTIVEEFRISINLAIVYGSVARKEALPGSDVDLLIVGSHDVKRPLKSKLADFTAKTGIQIDLLFLDQQEYRLQKNIQVIKSALKEGVVLWKKKEKIDLE